ncbi:hypothetical protein EYD10_08949, partial [Varanus komodoensis]
MAEAMKLQKMKLMAMNSIHGSGSQNGTESENEELNSNAGAQGHPARKTGIFDLKRISGLYQPQKKSARDIHPAGVSMRTQYRPEESNGDFLGTGLKTRNALSMTMCLTWTRCFTGTLHLLTCHCLAGPKEEEMGKFAKQILGKRILMGQRETPVSDHNGISPWSGSCNTLGAAQLGDGTSSQPSAAKPSAHQQNRSAIHDDAPPTSSSWPTSCFCGNGYESNEPPQHHREHGCSGANAQPSLESRSFRYKGGSPNGRVNSSRMSSPIRERPLRGEWKLRIQVPKIASLELPSLSCPLISKASGVARVFHFSLVQ